MPRKTVVKRKRGIRQEEEREEQMRMAHIKMESTLEKIDQLGKYYQQQVENQLQLILAGMNQRLLKMKWNDFLLLHLQHFEDFKRHSRATPVHVRSIRSQSTRRCNRLRTTEQSDLTRGQVHSVDRGGARKADQPIMAILRWPKPGEVALSTAGSPLAVQSFPDRVANVHIPTKTGVIKLQPKKLTEVKCRAFGQLDENAVNQIKTLNANLSMILDMSSKMGKG